MFVGVSGINSLDWIISDIAVSMQSMVVVPIHTSLVSLHVVILQHFIIMNHHDNMLTCLLNVCVYVGINYITVVICLLHFFKKSCVFISI